MPGALHFVHILINSQNRCMMRAMHLSARQGQSRDMKQSSSPACKGPSVLLRPEDIRKRTTEPAADARLVDTFNDRGTHIYVYTRGILEWVLAQGYEVYVLTPQPDLRREDDWWLKLLPADSCVIKGMTSAESRGADIDPVYYPWVILFRRLGIRNERFEHTAQARERLKEHGFLFVDDIRTRMARA
jgi:hypothetical protein